MSQSPTTQEDESQSSPINTCGAYAISGLTSGRLRFTPAEPVYPEDNEPATVEEIKAAYPEIAAVAGWAEKILGLKVFIKTFIKFFIKFFRRRREA